MQALRDFVERFTAPRASRWLIGISTVLLTGWLQSHLLLAALHDEGATVRNAIAVYNSPEVRGQLAGAADWVFDQGSSLTGAGAELAVVQQGLDGVLAGGRLPDAAADALATAVLAMRDDALTQFESDLPARPLVLEISPLLTALGVSVPADLAASLGLPVGAALAIPVVDAETVDTLRTRYHWAVLLDRWGLLVGAVAGVLGVILARRPLRTFAIALMIGGAVCLAAIPLFGLLHDWLIGGGAGPWSPLVTPLVTSGIAEVSPWLLPLGVAGVIAGAGLLAWLVFRERRAPASAGEESHDERAMRPSTPWTKDPDSSVENSLASSTASSIATAEGTSSL